MKSLFTKISRDDASEIDDAVLTITEKEAGKIEWPIDRRFLFWYFALVSALLLALFSRVAYLDVVKGSAYRDMAERNSIRQIPLPAARGIIYDQSGKPLVRNVPGISMVLVPIDAPKNTDGRSALRESLSSVFGIADDVLDKTVPRAGEQTVVPLLLKEQMSQEEIITLLSRAKDFPGVGMVKSAYREYVDGLIFSHVLGYEGKIDESELAKGRTDGYLPTDFTGKQGIEQRYESELRGGHGYDRVEVDVFGRPTKTLGAIPAIPGSDVFLNIDADLQKKIFDSLGTLLEEKHLTKAAAVAIDPRDGAIRALVSIPGYDNNLFAQGIGQAAYQALAGDPDKPLFNRAISGEYPPGSTWKPMMATAALSEKVVNENTRIESKGGISVGNFTFGDWKVHGFTDIRQAIAVSSDVYFYSVGGGYGNIPGLGIRRIKEYAEKFGYGSRQGIDISGERPGFLPDPEWKQKTFGERWYIGDDYHSSIGQGFITATPLQIVNSIATIANGGTLYEPRIVSSIRSNNGKITANAPKVIRQGFIDQHILGVVREGMRATVTEGTATPLKDLRYPVAGKTGTAQFGTGDKTHGWFVSFAPYDHPKIAMIILVEGQGATEEYNTVPVTKDVYGWYLPRIMEGVSD
jgi:penicillin-binding protein 2